MARLVDKEAIVDLKHTFCWALETTDLELLVSLFTEDASVNANPSFPLKGRAQIRDGYATVFAGMGASSLPCTR